MLFYLFFPRKRSLKSIEYNADSEDYDTDIDIDNSLLLINTFLVYFKDVLLFDCVDCFIHYI